MLEKRKYRIQYGDLDLNKPFYRPTKEIFFSWLNDFSKHDWFDRTRSVKGFHL